MPNRKGYQCNLAQSDILDREWFICKHNCPLPFMLERNWSAEIYCQKMSNTLEWTESNFRPCHKSWNFSSPSADCCDVSLGVSNVHCALCINTVTLCKFFISECWLLWCLRHLNSEHCCAGTLRKFALCCLLWCTTLCCALMLLRYWYYSMIAWNW